MNEDERTLRPVGDVPTIHERLEQALFEVKRVIVGQDEMLERVFVALLAGGHLLLEGVPGLAKTLTVKTLARTLGGTFQRIQFTPDLVPSDLVGTRIYRPDTGTFETELGPVFCNFLLADEINRAPAKVQSALLEVMQEQQVTIGPKTYLVDRPFLVMATQNPIESEGTYPLPEAQVDRFMMKVLVGYPEFPEETEVVRRALADPPEIRTVLSADDVLAFQARTLDVYVDRQVTEYAIAVVSATRDLERWALGNLARFVEFGASPRGSIYLVRAAQALALIRGRGYVLPRDISELTKDVIRHRLVMAYDALAENVTADDVLDAVLAAVPAPELELAQATGA
ncbi:MAG TPA: AAA family ATPase [Actinomycetota bacterium]|nr:AAA family ATPase [Actinomycetota bacterium]